MSRQRGRESTALNTSNSVQEESRPCMSPGEPASAFRSAAGHPMQDKENSPGNSLLPSPESEGLKSNALPPRKLLQLRFSCSLGSTLPPAVEESVCNAAVPPHAPFPTPLLHPGPFQLYKLGQDSRGVLGSTALRPNQPPHAHGEHPQPQREGWLFLSSLINLSKL